MGSMFDAHLANPQSPSKSLMYLLILPVPSERTERFLNSLLGPLLSRACAMPTRVGLFAITPPSINPPTMGKYVGAAEVYNATSTTLADKSASSLLQLWNIFGFQVLLVGSLRLLSKSKVTIATFFP